MRLQKVEMQPQEFRINWALTGFLEQLGEMKKKDDHHGEHGGTRR